jgi:hypothetical protein
MMPVMTIHTNSSLEKEEQQEILRETMKLDWQLQKRLNDDGRYGQAVQRDVAVGEAAGAQNKRERSRNSGGRFVQPA